MKIAYLTAGAAGMYCGTCMHDNTLAATLIGRGHDVVLVPLYTPIRTDEPDVSGPQIFFGGINVYLQQKTNLFQKTPRAVDWLLDRPLLLRLLSRFSASTQPTDLGETTLSMLQGEQGRQRKELSRLIRWLAAEVQPEIVCLSNSLLAGVVRELKQQLQVPVVCCFSGEDLYLDALPEPWHGACIDELRERLAEVDGFIAPSRYCADVMSQLLDVPSDRVSVVPLGLNLKGHGVGKAAARKSSPVEATGDDPLTIGYLARICPEKGLHLLVEAFRRLREAHPDLPCRLHAGGYVGPADRAYFEDVRRDAVDLASADLFQYVGAPDRAGKIAFLNELDVFSVPTTCPFPKGLGVLEALANGVPVVQPRHGSFPELIEATGGGLLVEPNDPAALADALATILRDGELRGRLARAGREAVHSRFSAEAMADAALAAFAQHLRGKTQPCAPSEARV